MEEELQRNRNRLKTPCGGYVPPHMRGYVPPHMPHAVLCDVELRRGRATGVMSTEWDRALPMPSIASR